MPRKAKKAPIGRQRQPDPPQTGDTEISRQLVERHRQEQEAKQSAAESEILPPKKPAVEEAHRRSKRQRGARAETQN
jgi:hypothetical protein